MAPYHGLPGKHTALRTVFAAGELTQAKVVVVVDPLGPTTSPERVTELVSPIARSEVEFLAPCHRRHPRDGVLVTQLARPLVRALYGVALDEPLGPEFSCSGRFASHCLEQDIWDQDVARFAIDLWLRTEAVAQAFAIGQIRRPAATVAGAHTRLREAVQQVVLALIESLRAHESFWSQANGVVELRSVGHRSDGRARRASLGLPESGRPGPPRHRRDQTAARGGARREACSRASPRRLADPEPLSDDELWVTIVYAFVAAAHRGRPSIDQLAGMFVPLYLWRAAAFMRQAAVEADATVEEGLESLCQTFQRLKPSLVERWSAEA